MLCLQYEGNLLISGSSDSKVRIWDLSTGECLHILDRHYEAVLHLRFRNNVLVTCSKVSFLSLVFCSHLPCLNRFDCLDGG